MAARPYRPRRQPCLAWSLAPGWEKGQSLRPPTPPRGAWRGGEEGTGVQLFCSPEAFPNHAIPARFSEGNVAVSHWAPRRLVVILTSMYQAALLLLRSRFSRGRLCATQSTAAHQAPRSLGFSRQEHWSGLPFPLELNFCTLMKNGS